MEARKVYKPRSRKLGIFSTSILFLLSLVPAILILKLEKSLMGKFIGAGSFIIVSILSIVFLHSILGMKYIITENSLVLKAGLFKWEIPLKDIKSVYLSDLKFHPQAAWRLPGAALFSVYYMDVGKVRMCATSMCRDILLIKTEKDLWGITPQDVEKFVRELKKKI